MKVKHRYLFTCAFGLCDCEEIDFAILRIKYDDLDRAQRYLDVSRSNTNRIALMEGIDEKERAHLVQNGIESIERYKKKVEKAKKEIEELTEG